MRERGRLSTGEGGGGERHRESLEENDSEGERG